VKEGLAAFGGSPFVARMTWEQDARCTCARDVCRVLPIASSTPRQRLNRTEPCCATVDKADTALNCPGFSGGSNVQGGWSHDKQDDAQIQL